MTRFDAPLPRNLFQPDGWLGWQTSCRREGCPCKDGSRRFVAGSPRHSDSSPHRLPSLRPHGCRSGRARSMSPGPTRALPDDQVRRDRSRRVVHRSRWPDGHLGITRSGGVETVRGWGERRGQGTNRTPEGSAATRAGAVWAAAPWGRAMNRWVGIVSLRETAAPTPVHRIALAIEAARRRTSYSLDGRQVPYERMRATLRRIGQRYAARSEWGRWSYRVDLAGDFFDGGGPLGRLSGWLTADLGPNSTGSRPSPSATALGSASGTVRGRRTVAQAPPAGRILWLPHR